MCPRVADPRPPRVPTSLNNLREGDPSRVPLPGWAFPPYTERRAALRHLRAWPPAYIYLDTYMLCGVYEENGICVRHHCGAEPPRDTGPLGLVTTVGWRDRASTSYAAADRVKAPARAARGRFRRIHGGRTAPPLPAET